ncbi:hypothetical protein [Paraburkholderia sp. GAS42]|jgi:hypothetical protein|uniref:hypothetical protein n=1 Tax=Paraburkholderia sp. GAS42 TaxID=3035135 RepID=UPI003D223835
MMHAINGDSDFDAIFLEEIDTFLSWTATVSSLAQRTGASTPRWFDGEVIRVRVQIGAQKLCSGGSWAICLADVSVHSTYRGSGFFTMLLNAIVGDESTSFDCVEIGSRCNDRFSGWLVRHGFEIDETSEKSRLRKSLK